MVSMIFSFFLRTIKHVYTLFQTRKMIFNTRTHWTMKIRLLHCSEREKKRISEQKRKKNVFLTSENNWKATKWGICVHLFNISFFFGCKQIWINTKAKRKMYFSVKRLILNAWETFCKVLKGYFYFVVVSSRRKLGIKTR